MDEPATSPSPPDPTVDAAGRRPDPGPASLPLVAYVLPGKERVPALVPAAAGRAWMRETNRQFAHRCLPLLMANQSGWLLLNPESFRVTWDGGATPASLHFEYPGARPESPIAISAFGHGILTWYLRYLFRTPPGYNLLVRGPANEPRDGIAALEGLVETDWAVASFTMNWKLTRPDHPVAFGEGEPFCMIVPQRRHELEAFAPSREEIEGHAALAAQWREFDRRRVLMNGLRQVVFQRAGQAGADRVPWERHYFEGTSPGGASAPEHEQKRSLKGFAAADRPTGAPPR